MGKLLAIAIIVGLCLMGLAHFNVIQTWGIVVGILLVVGSLLSLLFKKKGVVEAPPKSEVDVQREKLKQKQEKLKEVGEKIEDLDKRLEEEKKDAEQNFQDDRLDPPSVSDINDKLVDIRSRLKRED